jgi:hypothetical protein
MQPQEPSGSSDRSQPVSARKPYEKPHLQVYGDLTEIAQTIASQTKLDGAGHPNRHFTN